MNSIFPMLTTSLLDRMRTGGASGIGYPIAALKPRISACASGNVIDSWKRPSHTQGAELDWRLTPILPRNHASRTQMLGDAADKLHLPYLPEGVLPFVQVAVPVTAAWEGPNSFFVAIVG